MKTDDTAIWVGNEKFVPYLTEVEIQKRIAEIGEVLSEEYKAKLPIFIGVLNGSFMFMADLMKNFSANCEIDFFKLSSYGDEKIKCRYNRPASDNSGRYYRHRFIDQLYRKTDKRA